MASLTLDIQSELPKAIRWTDAMTKQLPWMIAKAMTESSKKAQAAVKAQAQQKIQGGPTPFTRNSTFVKFASPRKLESSVGFKDFAPKGTPAAKYLQPIVAGEPRRAGDARGRDGGFGPGSRGEAARARFARGG